MPAERKVQGIVALYAQKMNNPPRKQPTDSDLLKASLKEFESLKDIANVTGKQMMSTQFMRGYQISVIDSKGAEKFLIAFVYPVLNRQVCEFLVQAAKKDSINGIIGVGEHVTIVKEYKLQGGAPSTPAKV